MISKEEAEEKMKTSRGNVKVRNEAGDISMIVINPKKRTTRAQYIGNLIRLRRLDSERKYWGLMSKVEFVD